MNTDRVKRIVQGLARSVGVDVRRSSSVPFGLSWKDDVWALMDSSRRRNPTLFDVGANVGQTALPLAQRFPQSRIFSFEPVPATFAELRRNTAPVKQIRPLNIALGDRQRLAPVTTDRGRKNTFVPDTSSHESTTVQIETVDRFCEAERIERVDLLKVDTEGFEMPVLRGAERTIASAKIDFVVCECDFAVRDDLPHGNFFEIHEFLTHHGFRIVSFYTGGVDGGGWAWGDVLMMRTDSEHHRLLRTSPVGS